MRLAFPVKEAVKSSDDATLALSVSARRMLAVRQQSPEATAQRPSMRSAILLCSARSEALRWQPCLIRIWV